MRRRKSRTQHVALRARRRSEIRHSILRALRRGLAAGGILGGLFVLIGRPDSAGQRFIRRHTPSVQVQRPQSLAGLHALEEVPRHRVLLWWPLLGKRIERRLTAKYAALRSVRLERQYAANRIVMRLEPRSPLARLGDSGMDSEGVVFPLPPGSWDRLPLIEMRPTLPKKTVGRWLRLLAQTPGFWSQVAAIRDDALGHLTIELRNGTQIAWGPPEDADVRAKVESLVLAMSDVRARGGGVSRADLRFFDEGRIILMPKRTLKQAGV